jgi:hypothetical protein
VKDLIGRLLTHRFIDSPIFVVGANRSGTSILLRALSAHPLVWWGIGEAPLMTMVAAIPDTIDFSDFSSYYVENLRVPRSVLYSNLRRLCFEYAVGQNYGLDRTVQGLKKGDFSIRKKRYWCAKIFPEEGHCRGLRQLFKNARFLYIVRNGIEVVHSRTKFAGFKNLDFEAQCRAWATSFEFFDHLADADDAIRLRHEDLVADAEGFMRQVFSFLPLPYDRRPVNLVKSTLVIPLDQPSASGVDARQMLESRRPAYEGWTVEQRATFKAIAGHAMAHAGYEIPF